MKLRSNKRINKNIIDSDSDSDNSCVIDNEDIDFDYEEDEDFDYEEEEDDDEEEEEEDFYDDDDEEFVIELDDNDTYKNMLEYLKENDKPTYDKLVEVNQVIENSLPNITDILNEELSIKNKARIIELYEVFKMTQPLTEEWLLLKDRINMLIEVYKEEYVNLNSDISIKDKLRLIDMYSMFTVMVPFTEDWYNLRHRLNSLTQEFIEDFKRLNDDQRQKINKEVEKLDTVGTNTLDKMKADIAKLNASKDNKSAIFRRFQEIRPGSCSEENNKLKKWVTCAINLPHNNVKRMKSKNVSNFMREVAEKLDESLFGMNKVKEQLLVFLNNRLTNPNMKGCSLGLKGPPGVGKTTIARLIAKVMNWPFEQISFGGVTNVDFLKGHDFTYVGSRPGEIVRCLTRMKYKNGILFFDEFEKISDNKQMLASLLHITDFQQNHEFVDNYLADIKIDLSSLWFIYSMNGTPKDSALRDRLYIIELDGYNVDEKVNILIKFVLPKLLKNIGLDKYAIKINEDVAKEMISKYDKDTKGIRNIENIMKDVISKINFLVKNYDNLEHYKCLSFTCKDKLEYPVEITNDLLKDLLKGHNNLYENFSRPPFGMYL